MLIFTLLFFLLSFLRSEVGSFILLGRSGPLIFSLCVSLILQGFILNPLFLSFVFLLSQPFQRFSRLIIARMLLLVKIWEKMGLTIAIMFVRVELSVFFSMVGTFTRGCIDF